MASCLVMFSGGLDSVIAVHLLKTQRLDVTALHFVLPFESGIGKEHDAVRRYAAALDVPLRIEEEGREFLCMVKNPHFGYGKYANPCVDCRIHRLQKAKTIMEETGASFIATGEVIGQRPMSQRRDSMFTVEKRSGLKGLLLRPLSAQLLPQTDAEIRGVVDRDKLLSICGRGRKHQFAYAKKHGLVHATPAGGCLLTEESTGRRFEDLREHKTDFDIVEFSLLAYGRHFRLSPHTRVIVGRNHQENETMDTLVRKHDIRFQMADMEGPLGIANGDASPDEIRMAAAVVARYSKARDCTSCRVLMQHEGRNEILEVVAADDEYCRFCRI
ncbi:MAG: tRNA 4-thiouridine(8) synthase ThiI [Chitinivibrionales bacterium]